MPLITNKLAGVMWKTVSEACNLACDYCYYSRCQGKPGKIQTIDESVLEKFISEYLKVNRIYAPFVWQGGEPLLAGIRFFEKVIELQEEYSDARTIIANSIQTNGTLINRRWAKFFKDHNMLIGVSIDGPARIHDKRRVTSNGKGSYTAVMRGINYLEEEEVDFNILTVIHEDNVREVQALFEFYRQNQFSYVQFIPCMDFLSQEADQAGEYLITPKEYGDFLCEAFDQWYNDGEPDLSVRFFDNMLSAYVGGQAELCQVMEQCPKMLVLEQNGDAYPCDFYIDDQYKLGNIATDSLDSLIESEKWDQFSGLKPALPEQCQTCEFLNLCHGGCPRNRQGEGVEFFCESYKQVFRYADQKMKTLANQIREGEFVYKIS
ncbi:anaerobic sulfatase maturase [Amphibacillus sp. Q70]|uniref:anaerobic sulfatase maturase n=1 Tax=Amphibacillus sp. Q70 TaxID=3453416 RepID=UPI003F8620A5